VALTTANPKPRKPHKAVAKPTIPQDVLMILADNLLGGKNLFNAREQLIYNDFFCTPIGMELVLLTVTLAL